ncbi:MAG: hypothetical protein M1814_005160 [Vezdaea aestivalis]|nr:MAG: hypothetical protein M1814_005160 [Vezdaea aestivalis]
MHLQIHSIIAIILSLLPFPTLSSFPSPSTPNSGGLKLQTSCNPHSDSIHKALAGVYNLSVAAITTLTHPKPPRGVNDYFSWYFAEADRPVVLATFMTMKALSLGHGPEVNVSCEDMEPCWGPHGHLGFVQEIVDSQGGKDSFVNLCPMVFAQGVRVLIDACEDDGEESLQETLFEQLFFVRALMDGVQTWDIEVTLEGCRKLSHKEIGLEGLRKYELNEVEEKVGLRGQGLNRGGRSLATINAYSYALFAESVWRTKMFLSERQCPGAYRRWLNARLGTGRGDNEELRRRLLGSVRMRGGR